MSCNIIFDIDGTLADTKAVDDKCFIQAFLDTFQVDLQNQDWAVLKNVTDWGITEEVISSNFNRKPTTVEYLNLQSRLVALLNEELDKDAKQFQPVQGAIDFFNFLKKETSHPLGIATGAWEQSACTKLKGIGLDYSNIAFANSDHFKTRADITRHAMTQIKEKHTNTSEDVVYFGDGAWDYKTCKELGIRFIGIDILNDGKLKALGAKVVFSDFTDREGIMRTVLNP